MKIVFRGRKESYIATGAVKKSKKRIEDKMKADREVVVMEPILVTLGRKRKKNEDGVRHNQDPAKGQAQMTPRTSPTQAPPSTPKMTSVVFCRGQKSRKAFTIHKDNSTRRRILEKEKIRFVMGGGGNGGRVAYMCAKHFCLCLWGTSDLKFTHCGHMGTRTPSVQADILRYKYM